MRQTKFLIKELTTDFTGNLSVAELKAAELKQPAQKYMIDSQLLYNIEALSCFYTTGTSNTS